QAGGIARYGMAGLFWQAVPHDEWPDDAESQAAITAQFSGPYGDCRQELVFIGQQLDKAAMLAQLNTALLTDAELGSGLPDWQQLTNPFQGTVEA
ncbi:GTP-binding protein, partial [Alishewanella longhuensis]